MSKTIRIGFIGAGGNTRAKHLPGFKAIPGIELAAVCNRSKASGEKVAAEFGIPVVAATARQIIDSPNIDAVCIGTWPNLHGKLAVAALRAGKHVLTEARMARNLAEAEMMLAEAKQNTHLVAQIVPAPMSLPFDAIIIELLQKGAIGILREVLMTCTTSGLADSAQPLSWRQDMTLNGKNTLAIGIFYEMVLRWLNRGVTGLVADAAIFTKERKDDEGVSWPTTIPESVTVLGNYADGARLVGHFSGVELTPPRSEIRLNGNMGALRLDLARSELWLTRAGEAEKLVEIAPEIRGRWRVEEDFINSIRLSKPVVLTNFETGVRYMNFTEAVWESWSAFGQRVTL
ncbi:MAG: Gfo/Idh/MocA family oxidoreductase [Lacunisphaera sp.]|nr:Gfo/Idh/MocA family oxidoreductase [Lacunisphaera sp.]